MQVVPGIDALPSDPHPLFVVVGVFDGLHLGHRYLLEQLVAEAAARASTPTVITFDHHPDEVLTGKAPPLLIDPDERLERLAEAGVGITVVQHFDDALRRTTYDAFVDRLSSRAPVSGFLMTPDAAFGFERRGTPDALRELGRARGFEVVVVPPFTLHDRTVRSSEIREAIASGDLAAAHELLGRRLTLRGNLGRDGRLRFAMPMALPPEGRYPIELSGSMAMLEIRDGGASVPGHAAAERVVIGLVPSASGRVSG